MSVRSSASSPMARSPPPLPVFHCRLTSLSRQLPPAGRRPFQQGCRNERRCCVVCYRKTITGRGRSSSSTSRRPRCRTEPFRNGCPGLQQWSRKCLTRCCFVHVPRRRLRAGQPVVRQLVRTMSSVILLKGLWRTRKARDRRLQSVCRRPCVPGCAGDTPRAVRMSARQATAGVVAFSSAARSLNAFAARKRPPSAPSTKCIWRPA